MDYGHATSQGVGKWFRFVGTLRFSCLDSHLCLPGGRWTHYLFADHHTQPPNGDAVQQPYSLGHCAWFVYGALMKQGSTLSPIAGELFLAFPAFPACI